MKIAVTTQGKELDSQIDQSFGRTKFLIVADTETGDFEIHDNTVNLNVVQGVGIRTGQNIVNLGIDAVITGNVDSDAFKTLNAAPALSTPVLCSSKQGFFSYSSFRLIQSE